MGLTFLPSPVYWLVGACLIAYVSLCSGFRDRNPGSDAWEHDRAIKALVDEGLGYTGNPTYASEVPSLRYSPYTVGLAALCRVTGLSTYDGVDSGRGGGDGLAGGRHPIPAGRLRGSAGLWSAPQKLVQSKWKSLGRVNHGGPNVSHGGTHEKATERRPSDAIAPRSRPRSGQGPDGRRRLSKARHRPNHLGSSGVPGGWCWVVRRKLLFSNDLWRNAGHSVCRTQVTDIK